MLNIFCGLRCNLCMKRLNRIEFFNEKQHRIMFIINYWIFKCCDGFKSNQFQIKFCIAVFMGINKNTRCKLYVNWMCLCTILFQKCNPTLLICWCFTSQYMLMCGRTWYICGQLPSVKLWVIGARYLSLFTSKGYTCISITHSWTICH